MGPGGVVVAVGVAVWVVAWRVLRSRWGEREVVLK